MQTESTNRRERDSHLATWSDGMLADSIAEAQGRYHYLLNEETHRAEIRQATRIEMDDKPTEYIALQVSNIMLAMQRDAGGSGDGLYSDNGMALEVMIDMIQERRDQIISHFDGGTPADDSDTEPDAILTLTNADGTTTEIAGTITFEFGQTYRATEAMYPEHMLSVPDRELLQRLYFNGTSTAELDQIADRLHQVHAMYSAPDSDAGEDNDDA